MEGSFISQSNHGIMDEEEEEDDLGSLSSFGEDHDDGGSSNSDGSSRSSDFMEDATSTSASSSNDNLQLGEGPLFEMSSLISQLPFKRGLSKHFNGKSQSFTSLSNVKSLEDLAKPERPFYRKKLKPSKSYGWGLDAHKALSPKGCSRTISKKSSKSGSFSSLSMARKHSFLGSRPPVPPQRTGTTPSSGQTLLFA